MQQPSNPDDKTPFVTLTPESQARGIRFPTEAEREALLKNLAAIDVDAAPSAEPAASDPNKTA